MPVINIQNTQTEKKASIHQVGQATEYYKDKINTVKADKNLSLEGKNTALRELHAKMNAQMDHWKEEVATERKRLEEEAQNLKPDTVNRKLDAETVAALSYTAKTIISRIAAEGGRLDDFKNLLLDLVDEGNDTTRQAFLDSYHEIQAAAERFDHNGKNLVQDYYYRAKNLMKTPEQEAYEAALTDAISQSNSLSTKLILAQNNMATLKESTSTAVFAAEKENKSFWS